MLMRHAVSYRRPRRALTPATLALIGTALAAPLGAQSRRDASPNAAVADVPSVALDYSPLLDGACAQRSSRPLDSTLVAHVIATVPAYRAQWAARGPALLRAEVAVTGQPFAYHEARPAIVTCGLPSISFPLVLNAQSFQRGRALAGSDAGEMTLFVNTLWHEMSHRHVDDILQRQPGHTTPLLTKYAGELPVVVNHLHLYAIQELVYRRLGLSPEVDLAIGVEKQLMNHASFDRAHEIVAREGADAFVRELRGAPAVP
jgi:hypothetical protein